MSNGVQLATAYISLNVRTDDIKKQVSSGLNGAVEQGRQVGQSIGSKISAGIRSSLSNASLTMSLFNPMEIAGVRWAVKAGAAIGGTLRKAVIGTIGGLGLGAIFGAGGVLTAGLDRLKTLQQSSVQLSLKLSPEEIRSLQKQISEVVTGTPIPLDKAMQAVPKVVQAGMRGDAVKQYIKDVADLTASTGGQADFERIALIMEQIRSKTKLAGEEMLQLNDAGVDVRGLLKQGMGWDDKTLNQKLKNNKVGLQELQKSIQKVYGEIDAGNGRKGLAQKMGQTFDGAIGALKTSASRLGANFISAILGKKADEDPLKDFALGINEITKGLNGMGRWVDTHRSDIHNVFVKGRDLAVAFGRGIKSIWEWLGKVSDKAIEFGNWFSSSWDKAGNSVANLTTKVKTKFDEIKTKISDIIDDLKGKFDGIFGPAGWFAQQFDKLGDLFDKVRGILGLEEATANAASPGVSGEAPFNPGPMAPTRRPFGDYPSRAGVAPGTRIDGSDQRIAGSSDQRAAGRQPSVTPGGFNRTAVLGRVPAGRYVTAEEFAVGDVKTLGDLTLGLGDCTSAIQDLVNLIEGKPTGGRALSDGQSFWTGNAEQWAAENGFISTDKPMPGTFQVGFSDSHAQATLPTGEAFNWGSDASAAQGGLDGGQGAWFDGATKHFYKKYGSGGGIRGAGTGTSDSIPAWLSNGEHVLTAKDVQAMGGQQGVYAFRNALHRAGGGAIGFAPGGAVDPSVVQEARDNIADLNNQYLVAQTQFNELIQRGDATPAEILRAQQQLTQTKRSLDNAAADLPIMMAGGTPTDRSRQESIFSLTDQLATAQQTLADQQAAEDVPLSQMLQSQYAVERAKRERDQAISATQASASGSQYGQDFVRSLGFIPAAAGNTGVAGTSSLAQFIGMGNEVVGGLIDTGTSLAQTAMSAAITGGMAAGTFGAGAAAAPLANAAASYGIQLLGNQAKRLSAFGFQMAGIGADALMEQLSPFGMPRWLGYDYGSFMPQIGIQEAALSTVEKIGTDAINKQMGQGQVNIPPEPQPPAAASVDTAPSGPAAASAPQPFVPKDQIFGRNDPRFYNRGMMIPRPEDLPFTGAGGSGGGGSWARGGAVGIYDNGGILRPGELAFNASRTPEGILTKKQWDAMMTTASVPAQSGPLVENLYTQDMQDAIRELEKVKRRDMMQYSGRP